MEHERLAKFHYEAMNQIAAEQGGNDRAVADAWELLSSKDREVLTRAMLQTLAHLRGVGYPVMD